MTCGRAEAIRPARPADAANLADLHAAHFSPPWSADAFEKLLGSSTAVALVATDQIGAPAGAVLTSLAADEAEILTLFVDGAHQREGIGRRLLEALFDELAERGARRLFLEVAVTNVAARELYATTGFAEVGRRRDYYVMPGAPPTDALVLARDIANETSSANGSD